MGRPATAVHPVDAQTHTSVLWHQCYVLRRPSRTDHDQIEDERLPSTKVLKPRASGSRVSVV